MLFTFPSRYCFSIGHQVVFRLGWWSTRLPTGFLVSRGTLDPRCSLPLRIQGSHPLWPAFPCRSSRFRSRDAGPNPGKPCGLPVWPPPLSLATTRGISVDVFSSPYLDVSVQAVPFRNLWIQLRMTDFYSAGFPHSEISGSMRMCRSPELIAACHVLRRLLMPRHSPCALFRLTFFPISEILVL